MTSAKFFEKLKEQYSESLPFVAYRKPNESSAKGFLQKDDSLYYTSNFTESGFVFSPFNDLEGIVLFPLDSSVQIESDLALSIEVEKSDCPVDFLDSNKADHIKLVKKGIETIKSGSLKKVVLSRKEVISIGDQDVIAIFQRLLNTYSSAFVYIWFHPKIGLWLGATPENLLSLKDSQLSTMSLAGTQLNLGSEDIEWDKKETEEQQIVTDYIAESLDSLVEDLKITKARTIKAGDLLHLQTRISGKLINSNLAEVIQKLHPTPAICGMPKNEARQFILENENYDREFYTGFMGELNLTEKISRNTNRRNIENSAYSIIRQVSSLYVNLRCMKLTNGTAHIYIGGGITKYSIAESEWEETINKANTMKKVL